MVRSAPEDKVGIDMASIQADIQDDATVIPVPVAVPIPVSVAMPAIGKRGSRSDHTKEKNAQTQYRSSTEHVSFHCRFLFAHQVNSL